MNESEQLEQVLDATNAIWKAIAEISRLKSENAKLRAELEAIYSTEPMTYNTPMEEFEAAIVKVGIVAACEWFGHCADSEFTAESKRVLAERFHGITKDAK